MENLINRIQLALHQLRRGMDAQGKVAEEYQVTRPQMFLLFMLNKQRHCKLTQLAEIMEVKPSAITVMIDRLENPGYVKRMQDPDDRRSILVELTPLGKELVDKAFQERIALMRSYLARLNEQEVELFTELLEKMVQSDEWR